MHALFDFSSVLLTLLGSSLALGILRHIHAWSRRRMVQIVVLMMPTLLLGLSIDGLHHFVNACVIGSS